MKKVKFITIISLMLIVISLLTTIIFASAKEVGPLNIHPDIPGANDLLLPGNQIIGIVQVVGNITAVVLIMVLGIKYVLGSVEDKAEYKKSMVPYLIGSIMIFLSVNLVGGIYDVITDDGGHREHWEPGEGVEDGVWFYANAEEAFDSIYPSIAVGTVIGTYWLQSRVPGYEPVEPFNQSIILCDYGGVDFDGNEYFSVDNMCIKVKKSLSDVLNPVNGENLHLNVHIEDGDGHWGVAMFLWEVNDE